MCHAVCCRLHPHCGCTEVLRGYTESSALAVGDLRAWLRPPSAAQRMPVMPLVASRMEGGQGHLIRRHLHDSVRSWFRTILRQPNLQPGQLVSQQLLLSSPAMPITQSPEEERQWLRGPAGRLFGIRIQLYTSMSAWLHPFGDEPHMQCHQADSEKVRLQPRPLPPALH